MEDVHVALDINVILIGTGMSDRACLECHTSLLDAFKTTIILAIDDGGHIKQLYRDKLGAQTPGSKWFASVIFSGRYKPFPLGTLKQQTSVKLQDEHFHKADVKYIRLALSTPCKRLVTEDADFSPRVCKILKKHEGVLVHNAASACNALGIA